MNAVRGRTLALQVITAAGLGVDAYLHLVLASDYVGPGAISQGALFRVEAAVAAVAAVLVLLVRRRVVYLLAFLVAASALAAVVLYRYVDVGALGPLPNMYEPVWFFEKTLSAVAEAVAAVGAAALLALAGTTAGASRTGRRRSAAESG
ncbi:MAG TPA: hypothetical protein VGR21_12775 [Cryptosporangiaceae bacterium]|nr:hypothetical protein [Cryptosporangiaceae bacterium]